MTSEYWGVQALLGSPKIPSIIRVPYCLPVSFQEPKLQASAWVLPGETYLGNGISGSGDVCFRGISYRYCKVNMVIRV